MTNRLTRVLLVALLASGCSFIQSWGDYRSADGMDAGTDGGGRIDAGDFDAGDSCNFCDTEGCPGQPECQLDPFDDCMHCFFPGLSEGDFCSNDGECDADLICELGRCLIECGTSGDCASTSIGNEDCVRGIDRSVCLDHECFPLDLGSCDPEDFCYVGPYEDEAERAGSICAVPRGALAGGGENCQPPDIECRSGHVCHDDGGGVLVCRRLCDVATGACPDPATQTCNPIGGAGGFSFEGLQLGACVPIGPTMCAGMTCTAAEECVGNVCRLPCTGPADCPSGLICQDPDGDGRSHCFPGSTRTCGTDSDCTASTPRCINSLCVAPCSNDAFCSSIGFNRCINPPGFSERFCYEDCPTGACSGGLRCIDVDSDGRSECMP